MIETPWIHNLDPFAIEFGANVGIRWYGLAYLIGLLFTYYSICFMAKKNLSTLKVSEVGDFIFVAAIGMIIGGRVGYAVFYSPDLFVNFSNSFPYWGLLEINKGGMASHGAIIGITLGCIYYARKYQHALLHLGDLTVFGGCVGIFCGRIANFINGELVGRICTENFPLAVRFPQDIYLWPTESFAKLHSLKVVVSHLQITAEQWSQWLSSYHLSLSSYKTVNQTLNQIVLAIQSGDNTIAQALAPLLAPRHPSQLYEAFLEGALLFVILVILWWWPRKPGVIIGYFCTIYALVRIVGEQFRVPDAHIGFQLFDLTRGQWLSIVMLIISLALLIYSYKQKAEAMAGWKTISSRWLSY